MRRRRTVMDFYEILDQIIDLLRNRGRVSYQALKRQFDVDDAYLEDLKVELIEVQELAKDRDGKMLVWFDEAARTPEPTPPPATEEPISPSATAYADRPSTHPPPYLAEKVITSRSALEGERKQVTVLFADIKGSTELIEDLDPEDAQRLLDPALHHMMDAVHRYEGTVNQVLGDGIMALFGAPLAHEDHAVRACYAALAMQAAMQPYTEEVRRIHGLAMQMRVGLNSGEVVIRTIGSDLHMDYSAVGQTTHLAARMEQVATPGSILMTAETLRLVDGLVRVEHLGPIAIKGVSEPVEVFELTGASAIRRRLQAAVARGLTTFVGRETEIEALQQALEQAGAGHGQVVAAVGEPGVGKSRLVYEFIHSHRSQGWLVLESASVSYGKATPYFPVIDLLKRYVHVEDGDDPRTIRAKVTGQILTLDASLQDTIPALLSLLDALPDDSPFFQLDPPQRRHRTLDGLKRMLLRESRMQPLLLVFEDLHWIDSETQALLDSLVESLPTAQFLLLVNYRHEYQHSWGSKTYYIQLRLDSLPPENADAFLQVLLGNDPSLAPLNKLLIERTEGNPFFLEECVKTLVETEMLVGEPGGYRLPQDLPPLEAPATVQAVLAARIDRLPQDEKRLLQTAAVIGIEVPLPLLQAIDEFSEEARHRGLTHLQTAEFLYETSLFPERVYTFKHALTHEVAYGSILQERRRILHARVLETLEALDSDQLADQVERLAHHALHGAVWDKVLVYFRHAGTRALAQSANRVAVGCFEQALTALTHLPDRPSMREQAIDLRFDLSIALLPLRESERALDALREAEGLAKALDDHYRLGEASYKMSVHHRLTGDYDAALAYGQRTYDIAVALDDLSLQVAAHFVIGVAHHTLGDYQRAIERLRRAVASLQRDQLYESFGWVSPPPIQCRIHLVLSLVEVGAFAEGRAYGDEAIRIAEAIARPYDRLVAYCYVSWLYLSQGDVQKVIPLLERSLRLSEETDLLTFYIRLSAYLAAAYVRSGRAAEALPLIERAVEQTNMTDRFHVFLVAGETYMHAGHLEEAMDLTRQSLEYADARKERGNEAHALRLLGDIYGHRDPPELEPATNYYHQSLTLAHKLGMRPLQAHCHRGLGTLHSHTEQVKQARAALSTAIEMYRDMEMTFWLPETEAALTQVE